MPPHAQMGTSCQRLMLGLITPYVPLSADRDVLELNATCIALCQFPCEGLEWKFPDITVSHMEQE